MTASTNALASLTSAWGHEETSHGLAAPQSVAGVAVGNGVPTATPVRQQGLRAGRACVTNDKAGSIWNLNRGSSSRTIMEIFRAAACYESPLYEACGDER